MRAFKHNFAGASYAATGAVMPLPLRVARNPRKATPRKATKMTMTVERSRNIKMPKSQHFENIATCRARVNAQLMKLKASIASSWLQWAKLSLAHENRPP